MFDLDFENGVIEMAHGGGAKATFDLIDNLFIKYFNNEYLNQKNDQAIFNIANGRVVMSTDAHVITPLEFLGGDIGCLSVYGTVNDVAMAGAKVMYLSAAFILEEGFPLKQLKKIVHSMAEAAKKANVMIVTGDTKVVEKGKGDGIYITTTGIGVLEPNINSSAHNVKIGDAVIISGYIGDHGASILALRNQFNTKLKSDTAPLNKMVQNIVDVCPQIHCLRDPTRGGLGITLNEISLQSNVGITIFENKIPIKDEVKAISELLGLDALYMANEGKLIAICANEHADNVLKAIKNSEYGEHAAIIGKVTEENKKQVVLESIYGGKRIVRWIYGEQLPRIC